MISSTLIRDKALTSFKSENSSDKKESGHLSMEEEHATKEHIIRANILEKAELNLRSAFYDIPKAFVHGLQGDVKTTTFHNLLQMAKFPYYLGGAMLYACFKAGGNPEPARKQGIGVLMYYTGMAIGNKFVDEFVKLRYGIDLNLAYVNNNGEKHRVFESNDFTRWDLLKPQDWDKMAKRMGIPDDVADKKSAVRDEASKILVKARAWKLAIGAILSAFGAGFVAKNDMWNNIHDVDTKVGSLKQLFKSPEKTAVYFNTTFMSRLVDYGKTLKNRAVMTGKIISDSFKKLDTSHINMFGKQFPFGKVFKYALVATPVLAIVSLMRTGVGSKNFVSRQEAMPFDLKVASDESLRTKILASINPNQHDFERIYGERAKQKAASASLQQDNNRNTEYQKSQNTDSRYPSFVMNSASRTTFGKIDQFFKSDGEFNG